MIYASFATHAKHARTIQVIDSTHYISNLCFDSMPKNPKERADENRPLSLCFHTALAPLHSARMHAYALPSFKEGQRVNMTPVKYHGGRNYKYRPTAINAHAITLSYHPHPRNYPLFPPARSGAGARAPSKTIGAIHPARVGGSPSPHPLARPLRGMRQLRAFSLPDAPAPLPLSAPLRLPWRGFAPPEAVPAVPSSGRSPCSAVSGGQILAPGGVNRPLGRMRPLIAAPSGTLPRWGGVSALPAEPQGSRLGALPISDRFGSNNYRLLTTPKKYHLITID